MSRSWRPVRALALLAALAALGTQAGDPARAEPEGDPAAAEQESAPEAAPAVPQQKAAPAGAQPEAAELDEAQRRAIFREVGRALRKAETQADERFRDEPQSMERVHFEENLSDQYKQEIAERHGISRKELVKISVEGFKKRWHVVVD